jgi:hypothetical protein
MACVLPQATRRILETVPRGAAVLQVGGGDPFRRADAVLDERERDVCARDPWPYRDGQFAFAVCTALPRLRDPVGVCRELARVAVAGYVEVPTVEAELAGGRARWLCDVLDGHLVFTAKPGGAYTDARVRVPARWAERLGPGERAHGLFWERRLPARERLVAHDELLDELAARVRARFEPRAAEVAVTEARERARQLWGVARERARQR